MIVLHHLENSRSQRVLWLLEELGLPYEIKHYKRDPKTMLAPPSLRAVHPLGKSPVITDGDQVVAESGAILEYLLDSYAEQAGRGELRPERGTPEYRSYQYWMHYAEGSLMPLMLLSLVFLRLPKAPMPFPVKPQSS
jgi:glutathione S-transferase